MKRLAIVTGANGFLGRHLCAHLATRGWSVRALVRDPSRASPALSKHCSAGIEYYAIDDLDWDAQSLRDDGYDQTKLIHCAYAMQGKNKVEMDLKNVSSTLALRKLLAPSEKRQMIFISSMAAHSGAASHYGRSKWEIEQKLKLAQDLIIKPGTIIGEGGLFARLCDLMKKLPICPVFYPKARLQIIAISDLCQAIGSAVERNLSGRLCLAHPQSVSVQEFYHEVRWFCGRRNILLSLPSELALRLLILVEKLGVNFPVSSENLLGLKYVKHFECENDLQRVGVIPLKLEEALANLLDQAK